MKAGYDQEIVTARDAEVRIYDQDPGTDDASDMYVIEALGVTIRIRLVLGDDEDSQARPHIGVDATGPFTVSVNDDAHTYND